MLGKLLPFLKRVQNPKQEVSLPSSQYELVPDNLVVPEEVSPKELSGYFQFSVFIITVFIALSVTNTVLGTFLSAQKNEQDKLISGLDRLSTTEKNLTNLSRKISFYKNSLGSRKLLSEKAGFVLDNLSPGLVLNSATLSSKKFSVSLTGKNIYAFTQLIMYYLQDKNISEISINSANFNPSVQEFTVELSGVFK
jgi:hypothetical protein